MRKRYVRLPVVIAIVLCFVAALGFCGVVIANILLAPEDPPGLDEDPAVAAVVPSAPDPTPTPVPTPTPEPTGSPELPDFFLPPGDRQITELPIRMRIPALSLDYEIQATGADRNGTMVVAPGIEVISWFDRSSIPGNEGNAIFGGHNSWSGVRSKIYTLDKLEIGELMEIDYDDGTCLRFFLESVFVYELRTAPSHLIMDTAGDARLTLITCKAPFNTVTGTSDNRIVAIFKEESAFVFPDPPVEKFPTDETAG